MESGPILLDPRLRSPDPAVCPFLRSLQVTGQLAAPVSEVDPLNRCVALGVIDELESGTQSSLCLAAGHVDCPRYLRGAPATVEARLSAAADAARVASQAFEPTARPATSRGQRRTAGRPTVLTVPVIVASLFLVVATATAVAFAAARGGLDLPTPGASGVARASLPPSTPGPTVPVTAGPSVGPTLTPNPSPAATVEPTPGPTAGPSPSGPSGPTADRLAVLVACPGKPDCYVYTVRAGNNLVSIAAWFGVPYQRVLQLNPWIVDPTTIHPGDKVTIPTPTR